MPSSYVAVKLTIHVHKKKLHLSVNVFTVALKYQLGINYFYVSYWGWDDPFIWSSEPHEGVAFAKQRQYLLSGYWSSPEDQTYDPLLCSQELLTTDWKWIRPMDQYMHRTVPRKSLIQQAI